MPWPIEVPVFDESMIHKGLIGVPKGAKEVCRWLGDLFTTSSPEWERAVKLLASIDDSMPDIEATGYLSSLILWPASKQQIAASLNKLMARLNYTEDA